MPTGYLVQAVRHNGHGDVERVKWCAFENDSDPRGRWIGETAEVDAIVVVYFIHSGALVKASARGEQVDLQVVSPNGVETIALDHDTMTTKDLPRF